MKRQRYVISAVLLVVAVLGFTAAGPWALSRLLCAGAAFSGWQLSVAAHEGSLFGRFALVGVAAEGSGLDIAAERLEVSLWRYEVDILRPVVAWVGATVEEEDSAPKALTEISLPLDYFPTLTLRQGALGLSLPSSQLKIDLDGLELSYKATADTIGELYLAVAGGKVEHAAFAADQTRGQLQLELTPHSAKLDTLHLVAVADTLPVDFAAWGSLSLSSPLSTKILVRLITESSTLGGSVNLFAAGLLDPLDLMIHVDGAGHHQEIGNIEHSTKGKITPEKVELTSSTTQLWDGELRLLGTYHLHSDTLAAQVWLDDLDLAQMPGVSVEGRVNGTLAAVADLGRQRYDANLEIALRQVQLIEGKAIDVDIKATHRPDRRTDVDVRSSAFALSAQGTVEPDGTYDLALQGTAAAAEFVDYDAAPLHLTGRAQTDALHLHIEATRLPREFGDFGAVALDVDLTDQRLLRAALSVEEDLLRLELAMDLETGRVDSVAAALSSMALERLLPGIEGQLSGQVRADGKFDDLRAASAWTLQEAAYQGWHSGPLDLDLDYQEGRLSCNLQGRALALNVALDAEKNVEVRAQFNGPVLRRVAPEDVVELVGALEWSSNLQRPGEQRAELQLQHLLWRQASWFVELEDSLHVWHRERHTRIEPVRLQTTLGPLAIAGDVRQDSVDIAVALMPLDLTELAVGVRAAGELQLALGGTLERPRIDSRAELRRIFLDSLLLGDLQVELQVADTLVLAAALSLTDLQRPEIELVLSAPLAPLLSGSMDSTSAVARLQLGVRQLDLEALFTYFLEKPTSGLIDVEADLTLPLTLVQAPTQWHDLAGYLRFNELQLKTAYTADTLRLELPESGEVLLRDTYTELRRLRLEAQRYDEDAAGYVAAGSVELSGEVRADSAAHIALHIVDLDLLTFGGPEGELDVQARFAGTPKDPQLTLDIEIETEDLGEVSGQFVGAGNGAELELVWSSMLADELQISGGLPWDWDAGDFYLDRGYLDLTSESIDLFAFLEQFPNLDDIGGRFGVAVGLRGFDEHMQLQGAVTLLDTLSFTLPDTEPSYWFTKGKVEFADRQAQLVDFKGTSESGKGKVELAGRLDLSNVEDLGFEVRVQVEDLPYRYEDIFIAPGLNVDLALTGSESSSRLSGRIGVRQALTEMTLVTLNAPTPPPRPPTLKDEMLENLTLDVSTSIEKLEIDSEAAQGYISGNINVDGTFYKPTFQGDLEIDEGKIIIFSRPFDIQQGRIALNSLVPTQSLVDLAYDPLLLDPEVDLIAEHTTVDAKDEKEYTITMNVQGPARTAAPELTADPILEFSDIAMLLLLGATSTNDVDYQKVLGLAAGQLLSKKVEKAGLDEFAVLPSGTVFNTTGDSAVRIGKHLKDLPLPVWVRYEAALKELSYGELRIEHRLTHYLTIIGIAQSEYDRYGIGVGLKKDF